jgi:hypothetical protein
MPDAPHHCNRSAAKLINLLIEETCDRGRRSTVTDAPKPLLEMTVDSSLQRQARASRAHVANHLSIDSKSRAALQTQSTNRLIRRGCTAGNRA